ncbi:hypothetical protein BCR33DRAFT_756499 [Rhizoclosmatium globosum]|uniref:Uncharacterized protein n=1 Tax=Rhizoclosmatium globosum TaxID=329046 RepID=A0A1Y2A7J4_9FUNG|nr:hypothetical protein BCR33DRAFT_756499 [Rhizoclosmatium globosum]|eukprot:ORY18461.1 hypothetical protein BCR33DRAFT_756499 [Rhizoclosmatium globosum]
MTRSAPYEKSKSLGTGGSMVARLKLKGIDGRAPPGLVESVMPLDVLGRTRATMMEAASNSPWPEGPGNLVKLYRVGDLSASHQLALITSLPFVHTARRYYRLNGLVTTSFLREAGGEVLTL